MPKLDTIERQTWTDRFRKPTIDQLIDDLPEPAHELFDKLRERILQLGDLSESVTWYGDSWYWAIEYRTTMSDEPLAVMIPNPEDLQLSVPLDRDCAQSVPMSRMKRAVKDGLELAQEPFDTRWGVWSVTAVNLLGDLLHLIKHKLKHLTSQAS